MCGKLVCLTGIDGCGKSTQINYLKKWLDKECIDYEHIRFQDIIVPKEKIMKLAVDYIRENRVTAKVEVTESIYLGFKVKYIMDNSIIPLVDSKKLVLVERYLESNLLYFQSQNIDNLYYNDIIGNSYYQPNANIYLSVPAECCYNRIISRGNIAQHENMGYLKLAENFFASIEDKFDYVIDGCQKPDEIFEDIRSIVCHVMKRQ